MANLTIFYEIFSSPTVSLRSCRPKLYDIHQVSPSARNFYLPSPDVKGRTTPGRSTQNNRNSEQDFGLIAYHGSPRSNHSFISRTWRKGGEDRSESHLLNTVTRRHSRRHWPLVGLIRACTCNTNGILDYNNVVILFHSRT